MLIMGLRHLYWGLDVVPEDTTVFVSFFLGITIGPIAFTLFELLNKNMRKNMPRVGYKEIDMRKTKKEKGFPNPFKDRKSTRLNSSHVAISYAVFCLIKNNI